MSSPDAAHPEARPSGIDHIQLAAPPGCEDQAREFYGALLGLRQIEKPEGVRESGGVWFALARGQVHIGVQEDFSPARKAHPALSVAPAAIDALGARLAAAGARVDWDHRLEGVRRFFTEDPWGNRLELVAASGPEGQAASGPEGPPATAR